MIKIKLETVFIVLVAMGVFFSSAIPVMGEEVKPQKNSIAGGLKTDWKEFGPKPGEGTIRNKKLPRVAGVPLGVPRSEIMKLFSEKNIAPQQRTAPADIFPRLIGEISYLKKAYLFYTHDRLSKIEMVFDVPIDSKNMAGDSLFQFYKELRQQLVRYYGQPTNTTAYVHPNFSYELVALETGNAYYYDYWENVEDLKILLSLKGQKEKIDFSLTYQYLPLFVEK